MLDAKKIQKHLSMLMLYQSQYFESSLVNFLGYGTDMDSFTAYQSLQYRQPNLNLLPKHDC